MDTNHNNKCSLKEYKSYELDLNHPKHNKYTDQNIRDGIEGEKMIQHFNNKHMQLNLDYNDLGENYNNQRGADLWSDSLGTCIEVKNNADTYYLNLAWANELDEKHKDYLIKALFASIINSEKVKKNLRSKGWFIIEWGDKLTGQQWDRAISNIFKCRDYYRFLWAVRKASQNRIKKEWIKPRVSLNIKSVSSLFSLLEFNNELVVNKLSNSKVKQEKVRLRNKNTWVELLNITNKHSQHNINIKKRRGGECGRGTYEFKHD